MAEPVDKHVVSPEQTTTTEKSVTDNKVPTTEHAAASSPSSASSHEGHKVEHAPGHVDAAIQGAVVKDGIKVHPQPTTDPLDPLNWPKWRKHSILAIVMVK